MWAHFQNVKLQFGALVNSSVPKPELSIKRALYGITLDLHTKFVTKGRQLNYVAA